MSDNLYLFANNNGGQAENNGSYRLYDMKIEGDPEGVVSGINYVDYLVGDGASYIDTGKKFDNTWTRIESKYKCVMNWTDSLFRSNRFLMQMNYGAGLFGYIDENNTNKNIEVARNSGFDTKSWIDWNMVWTPNNIIINDITNTYNGVAQSSKDNISLLKSSKFYIYYWKVYDANNRLIQDLRPCLDTQGVPCMYDEVSKRYFYNQGTGTFKYKKTLRVFQPVLDSNNVPCLLDKINNKFYYNKGTGSFTYGGVQTPKDGYTEIEYIESNGTQYIDTGVVPNSNTDIDMTCRAVSNGGYILNKLQLDTTYKFNGTDTTAQPNLTASTGATLTMGSQNIALLTEAEIAQAVLNGWTIQ